MYKAENTYYERREWKLVFSTGFLIRINVGI